MATRHTRNNTAEFLIFTGQAGEQSIEARYVDDSIWLSQKLMAELFAVGMRTISEQEIIVPLIEEKIIFRSAFSTGDKAT